MKLYILMTRICKQFYSLSMLVPQSMRTIIYKQIYGMISNTVSSHMCMMIKNSLRLRSVYFHIKTSSTIRWIRNCPFDKWRFFPRNSYRETAKARTKNQAKAIQMLPFPAKIGSNHKPNVKRFALLTRIASQLKQRTSCSNWAQLLSGSKLLIGLSGVMQ